jgi:hypothetical protein
LDGLAPEGLFFSTAASFFEADLVLIFLSSLAIIFPNADLPDQIDPPLNFMLLRIRALSIDTPCGAAGATDHRTDHPASFMPSACDDGAKTKINILHGFKRLAAALRLLLDDELAVALDEC